jgi:hypothetical protein
MNGEELYDEQAAKAKTTPVTASVKVRIGCALLL